LRKSQASIRIADLAEHEALREGIGLEGPGWPGEVVVFASGFLGQVGECRARVRPPEGWQYAGDAELFVDASATAFRLFTWDGLALLLRGYARPADSTGPLDLERLAEEVRCHYIEQGTLAIEGLAGSFTLILLDGPGRRALLYRNLAGGGFTYYHAGPERLLFGSNLVELVDAAGIAPRPERRILPAFFLGCSTGAETLFEGFLRLLPGEQVTWQAGRLTRQQRDTFADRVPDVLPGTACDLLDETLDAVLADCASLRPGATNLLSGGAGSSYVQALWNQQLPLAAPLPPSFSVCLDLPETWDHADRAVTASQALGTRHTLIPADDSYAGYLLDALAGTGEPTVPVGMAYLGHLARSMIEVGVMAALCGVGARALFGTEPGGADRGPRGLLSLVRGSGGDHGLASDQPG
jgi:asparagine synthetase B (glutamine-hydrolysing)